MGRPKEALPFAGTTLLGRTVELLLDCTWPVFVVGRDEDQELPPLPLEATVIHDDRPGAGPLAAIVTGMKRARSERMLGDQDAVFVCGCDMPFLTATAVGWLVDRLGPNQLLVPRIGGVLQPLCAVYRLTCLPIAEDLLRAGVDTPRTLAEKAKAIVLDESDLHELDPTLRFAQSIDTPEQYEAAVRAVGEPQR